MDSERIRLALLGGLRFGKPMVIDMEDCDLFEAVKSFVNNVRPTLFDEIVSNQITKGRYNLDHIKSVFRVHNYKSCFTRKLFVINVQFQMNASRL